MKNIKRFLKDCKKYGKYVLHAGRAELKSDIASSHLSWMWWILDPLLFMLVYSFVSLVVFGKTVQYFSAFVFIGYTSFQFFEKTLKASVKLVAANKSVVKNIYLPKMILLLSKMYVFGFRTVISFVLVFIAMAIYQVPLTWHVFQFIPMCILLILLTFGLSSVLMHFGVYVEDLANVIHVVLRLLFYMSGVFYSIADSNRIKDEWLITVLLKCNPIAYIIDEMRQALLYGGDFQYLVYIVWFLIAILISILGINLVYKNENGYAKVI